MCSLQLCQLYIFCFLISVSSILDVYCIYVFYMYYSYMLPFSFTARIRGWLTSARTSYRHRVRDGGLTRFLNLFGSSYRDSVKISQKYFRRIKTVCNGVRVKYVEFYSAYNRRDCLFKLTPVRQERSYMVSF